MPLARLRYLTNVSVLFLVVPKALPVFIVAAAEPVFSPWRPTEAHQRIRSYTVIESSH